MRVIAVVRLAAVAIAVFMSTEERVFLRRNIAVVFVHVELMSENKDFDFTK